MKKIICLFCCLWMVTSCGFLEEQSRDLAYASSCEDLRELLIGGAYMEHGYESEWNKNFPLIHVMDDDIDARLVGNNSSMEALPCGGFYTWSKEPMVQRGQPVKDENWSILYKMIAVANTVISKVEDMHNDTEADRKLVMGEAKFLRAAYYFLLVNIYAKPYVKESASSDLGVPLKLTEYVEDKYYHRASVDSVYQQILSDLKDAAEDLAGVEQTSKFLVTEGAVRILLSRVYLYMGEWQLCVEECDKAMDLGYSLLDFNLLSDKLSTIYQGSPDVVFMQGVMMFGHNFYSGALMFGDCAYRVSSDLFDTYDVSDLRNKAFFDGEYVAKIRKKWGSWEQDRAADAYVIRYAEAYLNCAEALAMLDRKVEAVALLQELRAKRFAGDEGDYCMIRGMRTPVVSLSDEELVHFIRNERRRELCFEGHRWFDLRRYAVSPKYPFTKEIRHNAYAGSNGNQPGPLIGYYILNKYEKEKAYVIPIPAHVMEYNNGYVVDNEERDERPLH